MKKQILVVDDSESIREVIALALQEYNYDVCQAANGRVALVLLGEIAKVHLVISDINMPEMDGITFLKQLRNMEAYKYLPVIILTTESQEAKRLEARSEGATAWIVKPFKKENLLAVVKKVIG